MKFGLKLITIIVLLSCGSACAPKDQIYQGVIRGMYDLSNQTKERETLEEMRTPDENPPTYHQYKILRSEMLKE